MSYNRTNITTLDQVCEVIDSLHKSPKYVESGYPMIRVKDMFQGYLKIDNPAYVTKEVYEEFTRKHKPKKGDILFSRVGSYGITTFVHKDIDFCLGQNTVVMTNYNNEIIDNIFLYYMLISNIVKEQIEKLVTGSTQKTISMKSIKGLELPLPNITEQKAIANILSSLDDKIELNNQMNETLEEMAQALFKRWFVDFEFPNEEGQPYKSSGGEMIESELGMIPRNWICSNIFDNITEYSKKNKESHNYPVLSVTKESKFLLSSELFSNETYEFYDRTVFSKKIKNYKIIYKNSVGYNPSRANIGSIAMLEDYEIGVISPIYKVFSIDDTMLLSFFRYYMKLDNFIMKIKHYSSGTTRQNFDIECFKYFDIVLPPKKIQEDFENIIDKFKRQIKKNENENYILENLRDALLPKLMSGEIRVSDLN